MCGICGIAGFENRALLEQMTQRLRHRGPDDEGFHVAPDIGLGCRRLSIIDIEGGHQPMYNEDRRVVVIQNGEIFNYRELQQDLQARGHTLRSRCDTEVLAHAYEVYGSDFCKVLNGDFAIALWDEAKKSLLLARDRFGVHPLYYTQIGKELAFASELKSLLCWNKVDRTLDPAAIDAYLTLRYVPEDKTFFKSIRKLPPGCTLTFQNGRSTLQSYWQLPDAPVQGKPRLNDAADELLALLKDSVDLRLRADVPVGAYLSGGIDSSLIVALMRQVNPGAIKTFSIGFGLETDELPLARRTAAAYQTEHHEIMIGARDYELLPEIVWHLDEPIGDSIVIPTYRLAKAAGTEVKVVTSGEGADEVWGGYIHHLTLNMMSTLDRWLPKGWSRPLGALAERVPAGLLDRFFPYPTALGEQGRKIFSRFLREHSSDKQEEDYLMLASLYRPDEKQRLYTPAFQQSLQSSVSLSAWLHNYFPADRGALANAMALDMKNWLPNYTLLKQDKLGFAHGLEVRVPYLDHRIVEFSLRQPESFKLKGLITKRLLRHAASKVLPPASAKKRKQAFIFPFQRVFGQDFAAFTADILGSQRARERGILSPAYLDSLRSRSSSELIENKRLMALLILELWFTRFVDQNATN
jgi:asparagine synthase (glutamine-hydrolysing)